MKPLGLPNLLCYGFFGLPLAMVALPIYVYLPQFYAERAGLPLASIGVALLVARIAAAFIDPLLGWWIERGRGAYVRYIALALPLLLAGFLGLFHPPAMAGGATLAWFGATLMLVYFGFSLATIAHQSWGAALTGAQSDRARVTGVREACGLAGVVLAAAVTTLAGYDGLSLAFCAALAVGAALLAKAVRPATAVQRAPVLHWRALAAPFAEPRFRALFAVLLVNGVASAIPATLFLFFAGDRLRLAPLSGMFLILYFCAAALSMPLWIALARRFGEARAWAGAMLASSLVFVWAFGLGPGAALPFGAICILSGLALGADLALPPALLAGVIARNGQGSGQRSGQTGGREAAYFGVWNWGVQMTLALAAGIALPLLGWFGYVPGQQAGTGALAGAYALLPCAMKLVAAAMLWRAPLRDC
ncbi:MFS transporter [Massilia psychrophila]|uniref:Sodium:galactoside symporter n=1 Tax=Massilia psychrophila TaxID=1603353 RepID=A0A2G8SXI7_9BURK|nr:MFS transporter [Massilia psychrophila]PIL38509.1 sodium:galactoside symporter [Massilia psychrophila]GGE70907.1 sugar:cation symporter [Massilia psychrophila]